MHAIIPARAACRFSFCGASRLLVSVLALIGRRALLDLHERISAVAGRAVGDGCLARPGAVFLPRAGGPCSYSALRHVIDMAYGTPGVPERAPSAKWPIWRCRSSPWRIALLRPLLGLLDAACRCCRTRIGSAAAVLGGAESAMGFSRRPRQTRSQLLIAGGFPIPRYLVAFSPRGFLGGAIADGGRLVAADRPARVDGKREAGLLGGSRRGCAWRNPAVFGVGRRRLSSADTGLARQAHYFRARDPASNYGIEPKDHPWAEAGALSRPGRPR